MHYIVISADVVGSTALQKQDKTLLEKQLQDLLKDLKKSYAVYGRIVKGDSLEIVVEQPQQGLKIALAIKSFVKFIPVTLAKYKETNTRAKYFKSHGVRLAMGYGTLERYNPKKGIIDGEAIYLSGREISGMHTFGKERIVIKNTLFFKSNIEAINEIMLPITELLDVLLLKATERQSQVLYYKLLDNSENQIAKLLGIDQSVVNRHSKNVGWNAIDTSVLYFSKLMQSQPE